MKTAVLMYHEVVPATEVDAVCQRMGSPHCVSVEDFEAQMGLLEAHGYVGLSLRAFRLGRYDARKKPVVVTFDDGYIGSAERAAPILEAKGFSASYFLVSGWVGAREGMMGWDHARKLARANMELGSHTAHHPLLSTVPSATVIDELRGSREAIATRADVEVDALALPGGDEPGGLLEALAVSGYRVCGTSRVGLVDDAWARLVPRMPVIRNTSHEKFVRLVRGDPSLYATLWTAKAARMTAKRLVGPARYKRFYELVFSRASRTR